MGLIGSLVGGVAGEVGGLWKEERLAEQQSLVREEERRIREKDREAQEATRREGREADKTSDREAARTKYQAFQREAAAWQEANPKASPEDMLMHFSTTEYADVMDKALSASAAKGNAEARRLQEVRAAAEAKRADKRLGLESAREGRAAEEYKEKQGDRRTLRGLQDDYVEALRQGRTDDAEMAAKEIVAIGGPDPRGKAAVDKDFVETNVEEKVSEYGDKETKTTTKTRSSGGLAATAGATLPPTVAKAVQRGEISSGELSAGAQNVRSGDKPPGSAVTTKDGRRGFFMGRREDGSAIIIYE